MAPWRMRYQLYIEGSGSCEFRSARRYRVGDRIMSRRIAIFSAFLAVSLVRAADYPPPTEGDYSIRDFKFASGETWPELRIHYRTLGKPEKDGQGQTRNAVLITHGTTGSGAQFIRPEFAGELFGKDQPLDAAKFFIVLPDGIGHDVG